MVTVSYRGALERKGRQSGITTEVAALLTFLLGVLVMSDHPAVAIALAVVTSLLLVSKGRLHTSMRSMSPEDIHVTLRFALVAAAILPLLPDRTIDPLGLLMRVLSPSSDPLMMGFILPSMDVRHGSHRPMADVVGDDQVIYVHDQELPEIWKDAYASQPNIYRLDQFEPDEFTRDGEGNRIP